MVEEPKNVSKGFIKLEIIPDFAYSFLFETGNNIPSFPIAYIAILNSKCDIKYSKAIMYKIVKGS